YDNINDYYDPQLKYDRLHQLGIDRSSIRRGELIQSEQYANFQFIQLDLENLTGMQSLFATEGFDIVIHLAAQAGVRHSLKNPHVYVSSNVDGFVNILECCKNHRIKHLIYASSSSVYGLDSKIPFSEEEPTNHPVSLYAATKRANELMAYTYHHLYHLPVTGLRFFTVYGPWGRPDMSPMLFAKAIRDGKPIKVFNHGKMRRDFTFIDDIVDGIIKVVHLHSPSYKIYNIGNSHPIELMDFIELMEKSIGRAAAKELLPMQPGDVYETYADTSALSNDTGYKPTTTLEQGIPKFLNWYLSYYK
ncbi:MAG: NAD-dependent epimerase/dehydratase family protein, partial [Chitinophagaceae bacterium]